MRRSNNSVAQYGIKQISAFLTLSFGLALVLLAFAPSRVVAQTMEQIPYTPHWNSQCDGNLYDTPAEALSVYSSMCSVYCAEYIGNTSQVDPDEWVGDITVYQNCAPPVFRSDPLTVPAAAAVAAHDCSANPGYTFQRGADLWQSTGYCVIRLVVQDKTQKPTGCCVGNPIEPGTGNKREEEVDYQGSGEFPLTFSRVYNSALQFGSKWLPNWNRYIVYSAASTNPTALVVRPEGSYSFTYDGTNWVADADVNYTLTGSNGGFTLTTPDGRQVEYYDGSNNLYAVTLGNGTPLYYLSYNYSTSPAQLTQVADQFGHSLALSYDGSGRLSTMTDPNGQVTTYTYDGDDNIQTVTYQDGAVRTYVYNEPTLVTGGVITPHALTGIIDENSARYANFGYTHGLATLTEHAGGADHYAVSYGAEPMIRQSFYVDVPNQVKYVTLYFQPPTGVSVVDGLSTSRSYSFTANNGGVKQTGLSAQCFGPYCPKTPKAQTFDANGNVSSKTDFDNVQTTYSYDLARNLETSRTEAYGTANARTITTTWDATFRLPATITEPNRVTSFTYDSNGKVLTKTITDSGTSATRTWTYTYNGYGQVTSEDGPRTDVSDVTTYAYYSCISGNECGELYTVTDALGNVTTYNTYNGYGEPLTVTDPNGTVTTLTYDTRARLTSRQVGAETTSFSYWPTGLLKRVTLPDSSYLQYTYDDAHRLTQVADGAGNKVVYTLDVMGNRTAENTYDPSTVLKRTLSRVYDTANLLHQELGAAGTAGVTTTYTYDGEGNRTGIAAPLSRGTAQAFDELNRLKQITDPGSGNTYLAYDGNDNLTSVQDPKGLTTSYTYDGFGDLATQVSPDTGTTTNTYYAGGNLKTSTDARGAVTTYTYDALNRVASAAYKIGGTTDQTIAYTYDAGTNGIGHLTGASDANHSLAWSYDAQGRVTGKGQTVGAVTLSLGYGYSSGDMTAETLPSGNVLTYTFNSNHQVTSVKVGSTTIASSITYMPLGPVSGWTWGNSTTTTRSFDQDYKMSSFDSAGTKSYTYDDAFRITGTTDTGTGAAAWTYGYDLLDRVTSASKSGTSYGWTYDANGNRLTQTGTAATTFTVSGSSNRITSTTGALARTYGYDSSGNTTGYTAAMAAYNDRGRMKTLTVSSVTASYVYNALGQLAKQSGGTPGTVLYMYDEAGHLVGEYTSTGGLVQETVWLGDTPIATLRPHSGGGIDIYYVHADNLNTPIRVTRPSDNKLMWTWYPSPFGIDAPNENPASGGTFHYNLRFPGQRYDSQAGLNQNFLREYDPSAGRYIESDAIGALGGVNTYAYSFSNPLKYLDPRGTDVRVETTSAVYGLHEHISVDTPSGPYSISFGLNDRNDPQQGSTQATGVDPGANGTGSGVVYEDPDPATSTVRVLHTTEAQDRWIEQFLRQQVGQRGPYNVATNSCRTFSNNNFNAILDKVQGNWWQRLLNNVLGFGGSPAY